MVVSDLVAGDDFLGEVTIDLAPCLAAPGKWGISQTVPLADPEKKSKLTKVKKNGNVTICAGFQPSGQDANEIPGLNPKSLGSILAHVVKGSKLKAGEADATDTFIDISIGKRKVARTTTVRKTNNPVWNKQYPLDFFEDDGAAPTIKFEVIDSTKEQLIGYVELDSKSCLGKPKEWVHNAEFPLVDPSGKAVAGGALGSLNLQVGFVPAGQEPVILLPGHKVDGRLNVHVWKASGIKAADFGGNSDAYVILKLDQTEIGKTQVITSLTPEWKESFIADILDDEAVSNSRSLFNSCVGASTNAESSVVR